MRQLVDISETHEGKRRQYLCRSENNKSHPRKWETISFGIEVINSL